MVKPNSHARASKAPTSPVQTLHRREKFPINSFPNELLGLVFAQGRDLVGFYEIPFQVLCSHVCRRWRNISLHLPILWTNIFLSDTLKPEFLDMQLERNHTLPLNVRIDLNQHYMSGTRYLDNTGKVDENFGKVLPRSDRWQTLCILSGSKSFVAPFLVHLDHLCVPFLDHFEIIVEYPHPWPILQEMKVFSPSVNALRSLHLEGFSILACCPPLTKLLALHLDFSDIPMVFEEFRRLTIELGSLRDLSIIDHRFVFVFGEPAIEANLPSLLHLSVSTIKRDKGYATRFWSALSTPALESLAINCNDVDDIPDFVSCANVTLPLLKYPVLKSLKLSNAEFTLDNAADLITVLPSITSISAEWCDPEHLLRSLVEKAHSCSPSIERGWPDLHTISLSNTAEHNLDLLQSVVISRGAMRRVRFKSYAFDDLPEARVDWLKEHVEVESYDVE